jgi:hypothetical protein
LAKLGEYGVQMALIDHDQVIEALGPNRPDDPLGDGVRIGCHQRGSDAADAQPGGPILRRL